MENLQDISPCYCWVTGLRDHGHIRWLNENATVHLSSFICLPWYFRLNSSQQTVSRWWSWGILGYALPLFHLLPIFFSPSLLSIFSFLLNLSDFLSPLPLPPHFPLSPSLSALLQTAERSRFEPGFIRSTSLAPITHGLLIRPPLHYPPLPVTGAHSSQLTRKEKAFPRQSSSTAWRLVSQISCSSLRWGLPFGQLLDPSFPIWEYWV